MKFNQPLIPATLIRRYKRFLADVELADSSRITVHCPNSGSMLGCREPGMEVQLSLSDNPKRKYPHTLEMIKAGGAWVGINTARTNHLVAEAVSEGIIPEFQDVIVHREVKFGESRLDFLLEKDDMRIYMEVKNCTLARGRVAMFPDAVTSRGRRHLEELIRAREMGHRAVIFFCVQRDDTDFFAPAADIDPEYSESLLRAEKGGVEIMVWQARVSPEEIKIYRRLPLRPDSAGADICDNCGAGTSGSDGCWRNGNFLCRQCVMEEDACGCEDG